MGFRQTMSYHQSPSPGLPDSLPPSISHHILSSIVGAWISGFQCCWLNCLIFSFPTPWLQWLNPLIYFPSLSSLLCPKRIGSYSLLSQHPTVLILSQRKWKYCRDSIYKGRSYPLLGNTSVFCSYIAGPNLQVLCAHGCILVTILLKWNAIFDKLKNLKVYLKPLRWWFSRNVPLGFKLRFLWSVLNSHKPEKQNMVKNRALLHYSKESGFPYV